MTTSTKTYPLDPEGPLCPLLDDGTLLLEIYEGGGSKQEIKKFIKRNRWPGKPPISYAVGPETMKKMLLSLHSSSEGRKRLASATSNHEEPPVLYQVIWNWLGTQNPKLVQAVDDFSHTRGDKVFVSAEQYSGLLDARFKEEECGDEEKKQLVFLGLAFAMLQPEESPALLNVIGERLSDYKEAVGLA
jgi:hypothetical protein